MKPAKPLFPFDPQLAIGTVTEVSPSTAKANLPNAAASSGRIHHGATLGEGEVGEFVVIECAGGGVLGRIVNIKLPERERLAVQPELGGEREAHPIGTIQLLTSLDVSAGRVAGGILKHPRLGATVYSAHPSLLKWVAESSRRKPDASEEGGLSIAALYGHRDTAVSFSPEVMFGRHCAVLGSTGGGKSWTVARLVEEAARAGGKVILFDATGEFHRQATGTTHYFIGGPAGEPEKGTEVVLPYAELTETDLFALFRPSGLTQAPKLRDALRSLKLATLEPRLAADGVILKAQQPKGPFEAAYRQHAATIEGGAGVFDLEKLSRQVEAECVWGSGGTNASPIYTQWGRPNDQELSYCVTLTTRISDLLRSPELACIMRPGEKLRVGEAIDRFLEDRSARVLRLSLRNLSFGRNAREIVANAVGRSLLLRAREGRFQEMPLVVFVDEAHQFLGKNLGDEFQKHPLDAFELIAKEGRKFGLTICIATQRPRDIPEGVLSQMGTLVVHRLVNERDREVVESASGDIDRAAAAFLPTLAPGQAALIGVDLSMPVTVQVERPREEPDSRGPDYRRYWKVTEITAAGATEDGDVA